MDFNAGNCFISFLIESSRNIEEVMKFFSENLNTIKIISAKKIKKYENFVFSKILLAKQGHYDYTNVNFSDETRGGLVYYYPNGCKRIGLNVLNMFDDGNNNWLSMGNIVGEWPVAFTSIKDTVFDSSLVGILNDNGASNGCYKNIMDKGVQCCSSFKYLEPFLERIEIEGIKIVLCFQCRVNPKEVQFSNRNKNVYILDRRNKNIIRPYGIIFKRVNN